MKNSRRKGWISLAVAVLSLTIFPAISVRGQDDPPGRVARLSYTQGTVSLQLSGSDEWNEATPNYPLTSGDRVYADRDGRAELDLGNIAVQLYKDTDLTVANLNDQILQLGIGQGTIRVHVFEILEGEGIELDTPNGALTLLSPGDYRVEVFPDNNTTLVSAFSGRLEIDGGQFSQTLEGGNAMKLTGTDPIEGSFESLPRGDEFDEWSESRNRRASDSESARFVSNEIPGYNDLDNHGRWVVTDDYGAVWYPYDVPADWAPYRDGRWVWVEPWGWTWVDNAPWGYAPFHYGRWTRVDSRWCWIPGRIVERPVYAPALVVFVGGRNFAVALSFGSGDVEAWFPLGPREAYHPWYHHDDDYARRVNAANVANFSPVTNVTNINNVHYLNRDFGTTAVPAAAMRDSQLVSRQVIHVMPQQTAQAQIIPHPTVSPSLQAAAGGRPAPAPPIRTNGPVFRTPVGRPATRQPVVATQTAPSNDPAASRVQLPTTDGAPPTRRSNSPETRPSSQQPQVMSNTPVARGEQPVRVQPSRPTAKNPGWPAPEGELRNGSQGGRQLITRTPAPPPSPSFQKEQPALEQHPGRPLEPRQVDNIRSGRAAGPMQDREVPPHVSSTPVRESRPAPSQTKERESSKKDAPKDRKRN